MTLAIVEPGGPAVFVEVKYVKPALILGVVVTAWRREQFSYGTFYFIDKASAYHIGYSTTYSKWPYLAILTILEAISSLIMLRKSFCQNPTIATGTGSSYLEN